MKRITNYSCARQPLTSILSVTAAEIKAVRRSCISYIVYIPIHTLFDETALWI